MANVVKKGFTRVFVIENRAGPANAPQYVALGFAGAPSQGLGDVEKIEAPSQTKRGSYDTLDTFVTGKENASLPLTIRYAHDVSTLMRIARKECAIDVQVHAGQCTDPRDFAAGWHDGHISVFEDARMTTYGLTDMGSYQTDDEGAVDQEVEVSAVDWYQIGPLDFAERAASQVAQEIIAVVVCDSVSCGDCEDVSDGCQKVFAIAAPAGSSPGLLPEVIVTEDGFTTIANESPIDTLAAGEDPTGATCVGSNLVVVSNTDNALHYADKSELILGTETWARVDSGFVVTGEPNAIAGFGPFDTWIVGDGGYVYFSSDPTNGVTVKDAGVATTEDLNDVDVLSTEFIIAVGDNNAVIYSLNGGNTFSSVTGPAVGVNLLSVAVRSEREWWIGTADGKLYYTTNQGTTWTEKAFPSSGTGNVRDIVWASDTVGYMAHDLATPAGRILRTVSGGYQWTVLPDGTSSLPANDHINSLAVCEREANVLYAGGLGDDAADGIILKGTTTETLQSKKRET